MWSLINLMTYNYCGKIRKVTEHADGFQLVH